MQLQQRLQNPCGKQIVEVVLVALQQRWQQWQHVGSSGIAPTALASSVLRPAMVERPLGNVQGKELVIVFIVIALVAIAVNIHIVISVCCLLLLEWI